MPLLFCDENKWPDMKQKKTLDKLRANPSNLLDFVRLWRSEWFHYWNLHFSRNLFIIFLWLPLCLQINTKQTNYCRSTMERVHTKKKLFCCNLSIDAIEMLHTQSERRNNRKRWLPSSIMYHFFPLFDHKIKLSVCEHEVRARARRARAEITNNS